ncbi:MAG: MMPL family transporter [Desulfobacterota bacterium]|nr:MMPL family transporter [Thermodesulfobacteriota bacterium]
MNSFRERIITWSLQHWKLLTAIMIIFTVACAAFIPFIRVDTDPENMLPFDEPVRVFHRHSKQVFDLSDIVVVGVVNEQHEDGVFNPTTLTNIYHLVQFSKTLRWPDEHDPTRTGGVVEADIIAPSEVDHIRQGGPGVVAFEWLMNKPPASREEALAVRDKALSNPLFKGTMISEDGKALCIYLPLTDKNLSYRVYKALREEIAKLQGTEQYHITGLPVAEDTFGVEMFVQMAVSAPLAMLTIFLLKLLFFRKLILILSPMIIAMVTVLSTMGLLIGLGFPVHIMSSMIPIFLMPIAVVDSVHILSEFFDRYTRTKGRQQTIIEVMQTLFTPMLYTSLTSAAGFFSLALTPIPPVQVFGIFVAIGIMIAWVFTVTFVPAYVMMIPEASLVNFGHAVHAEQSPTVMERILRKTGAFTYRYAQTIVAVLVVLTVIAVWGITRIQVNDNPVKWFAQSHPIRKADIALNKHFGGTYMAYLILDGALPDKIDESVRTALEEGLAALEQQLLADTPNAAPLFEQTRTHLKKMLAEAATPLDLLDRMIAFTQDQAARAPDEAFRVWDEMSAFFGVEKEKLAPFKRPEVLRYLVGLQKHLEQTGLVGKSSSVADVVRKVNQELIDGTPEQYRIPDNIKGVAECLLQYQSSHKPHTLWHLVTPDYLHANIWLQLKSGDNKDMEKVVKAVNDYVARFAPPVPLTHNWAGLTYINVIWQKKMVIGMLQSFVGSFMLVFLMMMLLFRSVLWGIISMIPLTMTIVGIYGFIGIIGKDYDMPVAVLSALTLGMAIDFAIHFLERARDMYQPGKTWRELAPDIFGEPARAIARNVLVIAIGFLPLLAAPLVPYKTVGIFICAIMALSGLVTMLVLPALIKLLEKRLFAPLTKPLSAACNCGLCITASVTGVIVIILNIELFIHLKTNTLLWISAAVVPVIFLVCGIMSRRNVCARITQHDS